MTELEAGVEDSHAWPAFLPDGRRFVLLAGASLDEGHSIRLGEVDGGPTKLLKTLVRSQPVDVVPDGSGFLDLRSVGARETPIRVRTGER